MSDFRITDWGPLIFALFLVGLKVLEVVFRKISRAGQKPQEEVKILEQQEPPPAEEKGPYLPYEDVAEQIFGPYIEMRRRKARPPAAPPAPRPAPVPVVAKRAAPIVEDSIVVIEELPPEEEPVASASASVESLRRAYVASLIFSPPPGIRRLGNVVAPRR